MVRGGGGEQQILRRGSTDPSRSVVKGPLVTFQRVWGCFLLQRDPKNFDGSWVEL